MLRLPIAGSNFWSFLTTEIARSSGVAHCNDGDLQYVAVGASSQLHIVRRTSEEFFSATVQRESLAYKLKVVVNGNLWGLTDSGYTDVIMGHDPVPSDETTIEGHIIQNGRLRAGRAEPNLYYIAFDPSKAEHCHKVAKMETSEIILRRYNLKSWDEILSNPINFIFKAKRTSKKTKKFDPALIQPGDEFKVQTPTEAYSFGRGNPPAGGSITAMGGLTPMIIGGLKYGTGNKYASGVSAGAPATGEPAAKYKPYLTQRNDARYAGQAAKTGERGGKAAVALCRSAKTLLVLVVPHNSKTGLSADGLRDKLAAVGVEDALMMDGSDSAMLMVNRAWQVRQDDNKDEGTTVGLAFK
ncbi:hypothetical protein HMI51_04395 [Corallococcus coralloides]|nr:hypothetical protein [Corallococcus coralloides]